MQIYMQHAHMTTEQISIKQYGTVLSSTEQLVSQNLPFSISHEVEMQCIADQSSANLCTLSNFLINALLGDFRVVNKEREQSTV